MESKLNGLAISKGVSTDDVVRTIQALISAGYKGEELLNKIDEIYGVGARNNLLKTIKYPLPTSRTTIVIEYPEIYPSEKTKIGDILLGTNGYIGQITELSFDTLHEVSSVVVLGLDYNVIENILPDVTVEDNDKVLMVQDGEWTKDYVDKLHDDIIEITHAELSSLKENGRLVKNQKYRITDYETSLKNGVDFADIDNSNPFDIIVTAMYSDELSKHAYTCEKGSLVKQHEIKYDINAPGYSKGIIYWMKDKNENECPYDFKHIKFKRFKVTDGPSDLIGTYAAEGLPEITVDTNDYNYFYTFSSVMENSIGKLVINDVSDIVYGNKIEECYTSISDYSQLQLNNIVVLYGQSISSVMGMVGYKPNIFGKNCRNITLNGMCFGNTFCNNCRDILFGDNCSGNIFQGIRNNDNLDVHNIVFEPGGSFNQFYGSATNITLLQGCEYNVFGDMNDNISLTESTNNTFKSYCTNIGISGADGNTFGNFCSGVEFDRDFSVKFNTVLDNVRNLSITCSGATGYIQNCVILPGTTGEVSVNSNLTTCTIIGSIT